MMSLPNANEVPYFRTGRSSPDSWILKARRQIENAGGNVTHEGWGNEVESGRQAYMLGFSFNGDKFRVVWPVLPSDDEPAARRQAATLLFHDVKARCVSQLVFGARTAFFAYLSLPDGRRVSELAVPELAEAVPELLRLGCDTERSEQ